MKATRGASGREPSRSTPDYDKKKTAPENSEAVEKFARKADGEGAIRHAGGVARSPHFITVMFPYRGTGIRACCG